MAVTLKGQTAVYEGTSTDTKPTDADNNAIFKELDTGIRYYYDGTDWNEIPSSGGGGGGTGTDNYNDLNNKPSINGTTLSGNKSLDNLGIQAKLTFDSAPTEDSENPVTSGGVYTALATNIQGIKVNGSTVNPDSNKVVNITVPTSAADVSALPDTTKYAAALKLTINSSTFVMTGQLKDQDGNNLGTAQTIDLPLESVVVGGSYNSQTKKVVLTLQNGNTIEFSVADLVSGLQTELSASNKLNPAYIDYDSTHAAVTEAQRDQIETNKNNILYNQLMGVKNMAKLYGTSGTNNNVTYTYNSDDTITVKSDSATHSQSSKRVATFTAPYAGKFLINGIPVGASNTTFFLNVTGEGGVNRNITGDDEVNPSSAGYVYNIDIYVRANVEVDTTFSIMFRPESISDSTYQPYAPSNRELYEMILALQ